MVDNAARNLDGGFELLAAGEEAELDRSGVEGAVAIRGELGGDRAPTRIG